MKRRLAVAIGVWALVLASVLGGVGAAQAASPITPDANAWTEVSHPRPGGADTYLFDITIPAADDVWSVGYTFDVVGGAFEFRTYGQHCTGGVCTRANLPNRAEAPATNFLYGIDSYSPTQMWTVGYSRNSGQPSLSMAIRYDGVNWQIVNTPNPAGSSSNVLYSVADLGPAGAVAVGTYSAAFEEHPLAMSWDGASWSLLTLPTIPGCTSRGSLNDVAEVGRATVMAGTCRDTTGADGGFVLSRSFGGNWRVEVSPGDGLLPVGSRLESIAVVPGSGIWAVGQETATGVGISIRFNGRTWQRVPVPEVGDSTDLLGIAGISRTEMWTVGGTALGSIPQRLSMQWNGRRWINVPAGETTRLHGVAYDPAGFWWSVGHNNSVSVLQRIDA